MNKGHPHSPTEAITFISMLSLELPFYQKALQCLLETNDFKEEKDLQMIIQDPTTVNWNLSILLVNLLKNILTESISKRAINTDVRQLFHMNWDHEDASFIESLSRSQPFMQRILNDLFMKSPTGQQGSFIATFSNMRSTQQTLPDSKRLDVISKLRKTEKSWIQVSWRIQEKDPGFSECLPSKSICNSTQFPFLK